jgi:D-sedoheptulose 7-phosphate isomerase
MTSVADARHRETVRCVFDEHAAVLRASQALMPKIVEAGHLVARSVIAGGRLLVAGNGGSAADALHIAGELLGRFLRERRPLSAIALSANASVVTAIGNDYAYDEVFARQVAGHGRRGDVFLGISTSGNSNNVLKAAAVAREMHLSVVGLTGQTGGRLKDACDVCLRVPSESTPRIQEIHILIGHLICQVVEDSL